jgi:H+/Cl- antiporter ClcA
MAAASGLPQLKAYLNGLRVPGLLRFHTLITKVVGITLVVSMGLPMGEINPSSEP